MGEKVNNFLKGTNWLKVCLVAVFIIILTVVGIYIIHLSKQKEYDKYNLVRKSAVDSIHIYADKHGDTVIKIFPKVASQNEVGLIEQREIDSLTDVLDITKKDRDKYLALATQGDYSKEATSIRDTVYYAVDSSTGYTKYPTYHYKYNGRFLSYDALASDSLRFKKLEIRDSLFAISEKHQIGNKFINSMVIKNTNPNVKITGFKYVDYEQPKEYSRWSIVAAGGVGAQLNTVPIKAGPVVMVGIGFDVLRFKKKIK